MPRPARDVSAREVVALVVGACLVSVVMSWPLVLHLGSEIPHDLGDPLAESWQVAWDGYALGHQPLHLFQSNQFWPLHDTLAFSDALIGYAPAGLFGSGPHAAVFRYDLLFLFAYALAFAGAYLLGRELGLGPAGAAVVGAAFAFAPFRLEQDGHMQVISSGGIPLAFALGLRGYRLQSPGWVIAGFLVAAWQLSIGFTLGLPLAYLLAALGAIAAFAWWRSGRPRLDRGLVIATVAGVIVFAGVGFALSRPYVRVADAHPGARRTPADVEAFSGPPRIFLVAPEENLVWGGATASLRDGLQNIPEKTLFPGLIIVALAIAGLGSSRYPRRFRWGLGIGVVVVSVLALGFREGGGILWPYRVLYDVLPGWQGIRVPGRLVTFSSLGLAVLAGIGAERGIGAVAARGRTPSRRRSAAAGRSDPARGSAAAGRRAPPRGFPAAGRVAAWRGGAAVAAVVALAIVVEGRGLPFDPFGDRAQPRVPPIPPSTASIPAPQLHLPARRPGDNRRYLLWSTDGFPELVNGRSSFNPPFTQHLIDAVRDFPNARTVAVLSGAGVRSVVLHMNRAQGTPWQGAARRPIAGLALTRHRLGDLVVYEIR